MEVNNTLLLALAGYERTDGSHIMRHTESKDWTDADQAVAAHEGWFLVKHPDGQWDVERVDCPEDHPKLGTLPTGPYDDGAVFDGDDSALEWVKTHDSAVCAKARKLLGAN